LPRVGVADVKLLLGEMLLLVATGEKLPFASTGEKLLVATGEKLLLALVRKLLVAMWIQICMLPART